jgi:hypothetical protein
MHDAVGDSDGVKDGDEYAVKDSVGAEDGNK